MNRQGSHAFGRNAALFSTLLVLVTLVTAGIASARTITKRTVWIVFFSSRNCPKCEPVRTMIRELKKHYPVRVKNFDVGKSTHSRLFERLEAIHSDKKFSVPLIMVGESILMGENEIAEKLERSVRNLARSGGAPLPYLGPGRRNRVAPEQLGQRASSGAPAGCNCEQNGRPPAIGDEWRKIRKFLDSLF